MNKNKTIEIILATLIVIFSIIYYKNFQYVALGFLFLLPLKIRNNGLTIFISSIILATFTDIHIFNLNLHTKINFNLSSLLDLETLSYFDIVRSKIIVLVFYFFFIFFTIKLKQYFKWHFNFVFVLLVMYLFSKIEKNLSIDIKLILSLFLILISKNVYYLALITRTNLKFTKESMINTIQPFWYNLNEASYLSQNSITEAVKNEKNQKAFSILLSAFFSFLLLNCYFSLVMTLQNKSISISNDLNYLESFTFEAIKNWQTTPSIKLNLELFNISLSYLVHTFFIAPRIIIALAILLGFPLKDAIDSPWRSRSFSDFFSRTMIYYNLLINSNFYYPMLDFFSVFSPKVRKTLALSTSLILGGFIIHLFKDSYRLFQMDFSDFILFEIKTTFLYLLVLTLFVLLSREITQKLNSKDSTNPRLFRFIFYIYLYGLTLPFILSKYIGSAKDVFHFYFKLFNL